MAKMYIALGIASLSVAGHEYIVQDGTIEVDDVQHIPSLKALGASETPIDNGEFGTRVVSDQPVTDKEADVLRERVKALTSENSQLISENSNMSEKTDALEELMQNLDLGVNENEHVVDAAARHLIDLVTTVADEKAKNESAMSAAPADGATSGDTSEDKEKALVEETKLADPGFDENSDHKEIVAWLNDNGAAVPGNISKANALKAVKELVGA